MTSSPKPELKPALEKPRYINYINNSKQKTIKEVIPEFKPSISIDEIFINNQSKSLVLNSDEFGERAMLSFKKQKKPCGIFLYNGIFFINYNTLNFSYAIKSVSNEGSINNIINNMGITIKGMLPRLALHFNEKQVYDMLNDFIKMSIKGRNIDIAFVSKSDEGKMLYYSNNIALYEVNNRTISKVLLNKNNNKHLNIKELEDSIYVITTEDIANGLGNKASIRKKDTRDIIKELFNKAKKHSKIDAAFLFIA